MRGSHKQGAPLRSSLLRALPARRAIAEPCAEIGTGRDERRTASRSELWRRSAPETSPQAGPYPGPPCNAAGSDQGYRAPASKHCCIANALMGSAASILIRPPVVPVHDQRTRARSKHFPASDCYLRLRNALFGPDQRGKLWLLSIVMLPGRALQRLSTCIG